MWPRWLLYRSTRAAFFFPSHPRRDRFKMLLGRVTWHVQQALLAAHLTYTLLTLPFFWLRAHLHAFLFGRIQPAVDIAMTFIMGRLCLLLWTERDMKRWAKVGKQPLASVLPELVEADQAPAPVPLGTDTMLVSSATGHNMLVYRIPEANGGGLLLHNAVFLDDAKLKDLQDMGSIRGVICPSLMSIPRCMQLAQWLGAPVFMPRLLTVAAGECIQKWGKEWKAPLVAEEFPMEKTFGVKVHEPSGTKGHGFDGQLYPAENFYEFPQSNGTSILACGTILSDRDSKWSMLPTYETKNDSVQVPTRILREGVDNEAAFVAFLRRMEQRRPNHLVPSEGATVPDPGPVFETAALAVHRWAQRPKWLW